MQHRPINRERTCYLLFGRECISRPGHAVSDRTGAQGRVKTGRRAVLAKNATLPGRVLTGRAPCYHRERPSRSSAWGGSIAVSGEAAGDAPSARNGYRGSGRHPHGRKPRQRVPSRGRAIARDPSPAGGEGPAQLREKYYKCKVILFPDGLRPTPPRHK